MQIRCKSRNAVTLIPVTILEVIGRGCLVRVSLSFSCNRGAAGARGTGSVCRADGFYDVGRTPRVARPLRSEADVRHLPETQISFGRAVYSRLRAYARVAPRDSSETRVFYIEEERGASPKPVKIPEPRERRFDASGLDYLGRSSFVFGPYRSIPWRRTPGRKASAAEGKGGGFIHAAVEEELSRSARYLRDVRACTPRLEGSHEPERDTARFRAESNRDRRSARGDASRLERSEGGREKARVEKERERESYSSSARGG